MNTYLLHYLLGFYFADGYFISKNVIGFKVSKETHPFLEETFSKYFPISKQYHRFNPEHYLIYYNIKDTQFQKKLLQFGLNIHNKTKKWDGYIEFKNQLELISFLWGYFLGDGSFSVRNNILKELIITSFDNRIFNNLQSEMQHLGMNPNSIFLYQDKNVYRIKIRKRIFIDYLSLHRKFLWWINNWHTNYYKLKELIKWIDFYSVPKKFIHLYNNHINEQLIRAYRENKIKLLKDYNFNDLKFKLFLQKVNLLDYYCIDITSPFYHSDTIPIITKKQLLNINKWLKGKIDNHRFKQSVWDYLSLPISWSEFKSVKEIFIK